MLIFEPRHAEGSLMVLRVDLQCVIVVFHYHTFITLLSEQNAFFRNKENQQNMKTRFYCVSGKGKQP